MYFQANIERLAPTVYRRVIAAVERTRGYRIYVFRPLPTDPKGNRSAFGNRGALTRYEMKPYVAGRYVVAGLNAAYYQADKTADVYLNTTLTIWFHHKIPVERDSIVYIDRGNYEIDNTKDSGKNEVNLGGVDVDFNRILDPNVVQCFMVTDIKHRLGWGEEIVQMVNIVPAEFPIHGHHDGEK